MPARSRTAVELAHEVGLGSDVARRDKAMILTEESAQTFLDAGDRPGAIEKACDMDGFVEISTCVWPAFGLVILGLGVAGLA